MRNIILTSVCAVALATASPAAAMTLLVGLDASGSNPLVLSDDYARKIARMVSEHVKALDFGDTVVLETFGYHGQLQSKRAEITVSKRHRPKKVAKVVHQIVAALPRMVREGKIESHGQTNIVSFLRTRSEQHGCDSGLAIVLASDGIEASDVVSEQSLREGKASLPKPASRFLEDCKVTMLGVGAGNLSKVSKRLADEWKAFLKAAGAKAIRVIEG